MSQLFDVLTVVWCLTWANSFLIRLPGLEFDNEMATRYE
jgi:hypothetical protein